MSGGRDYAKHFRELLDGLPAGARLSFLKIVSSIGVSEATVKKHFKKFIDTNPAYLTRVTGFYPMPETITALVENDIGRITEQNLDLANQRSSEIVKGVARPIVEDFIHEGLSANLDRASGRLQIGMEELTDFLIVEFSEFLRASGNGLVSIAGSLNELLLIYAMINAGMVSGRDFTRTGKDSKADIIIHSQTGTKENLAVEVKSYHARERLLRGLQDIPVPKIGVGFFKDAAEFNPARTRTLLQAQPAAIYIPRETLEKMSDEAKSIKTVERAAFESSLYRPLEQFVTDMRAFNKTGQLPKYP